MIQHAAAEGEGEREAAGAAEGGEGEGGSVWTALISFHVPPPSPRS